MTIETKFKIWDFVRYKYSQAKFKGAHNEKHFASEVTGILTDSCYAGTQVFYYVRPIFVCFGPEGNIIDIIHGTEVASGNLPKFREDEIVGVQITNILDLISTKVE